MNSYVYPEPTPTGPCPRKRRAVARMARALAITGDHHRRVPRGATPAETGWRARNWAGSLCDWLDVRVHLVGESLGPRSGLLVANHRSYTDIIVLLSQVPCTFLAKREVSEWPVFGQIARTANTVFVDRDSAQDRARARQQMRALMEQGVSIMVFPEGTTHAGPGFQGFRKGSFREAALAGIPVTPVAVEYGSPEDAWVGDDTMFRHFVDRFSRSHLDAYVRFGPTLRSDDAESLHSASEAWIAEALEDMWAGLHRPDSRS